MTEGEGLVRIGHLANSAAVPALVDLNKLVTRHCAVLGTTGSGKSTTVVGLIASLCTDDYPSARILVFDIHGEYTAALHDLSSTFCVTSANRDQAAPLHIPYWAMTFDELLSVTFGDVDDVARGAIMEHITALKAAAIHASPKSGVNGENLTVDTPVPFSLHHLWLALHRQVCATYTAAGSGQDNSTIAYVLDESGRPVQSGDAWRVIPPLCKMQNQARAAEKIFLSASPLNIRRQLDGLASKLRDPRYDFLFRPGPWAPDELGATAKDLDSFLANWLGSEKPVTILDLSGVPASILTQIIGVLLRIVYDSLSWARRISEGAVERPLLIVLEEAHAYLGKADESRAGIAVRRIVKEGRKYGIGALIVSQRPAEIDPTILSQCGSIVAMRLSNPTDRSHVTGTVADNLEGLLDMLPVLRTGEAIVVGESVRIPMRALIDLPARNRRPDSGDPLIHVNLNVEHVAPFPGGWNRRLEPVDFRDVCSVWRRQDTRIERILARQEGQIVNRTPVSSSTFSSIGYDHATQTLEVEFIDGRIYQYFDVPSSVFEELIASDSIGKFYNGQIRGVFRFARL
ncbi:MAG: DUF87 domain-containing protein [Paludibaculum sp.]